VRKDYTAYDRIVEAQRAEILFGYLPNPGHPVIQNLRAQYETQLNLAGHNDV